MRGLLVRLAFFCAASLGSAALADVGPGPTCPPGTTRVYHMGYHCVRPGENPADPGPVPIVEAPTPSKPSSPKPTPAEGATAQTSAAASTKPASGAEPATPAKSPAAAGAPNPAAKRTSGCAMAEPGSVSSPLGLLTALCLGLLARRRRRVHQR